MREPRALDGARGWLIVTLAPYLAVGVLTWLAQGCVQRPERAPADGRAIDAAVQAWRGSGHRIHNCPVGDLSVLHARDDTEFDSWCGTPAHEVAASCLVAAWSKVVLRPGQPLEHDGEPVIHEALHLLILCERWPDTDPGHTLRWAWKERGEGTVQERAERLYRAP